MSVINFVISYFFMLWLVKIHEFCKQITCSPKIIVYSNYNTIPQEYITLKLM